MAFIRVHLAVLLSIILDKNTVHFEGEQLTSVATIAPNQTQLVRCYCFSLKWKSSGAPQLTVCLP